MDFKQLSYLIDIAKTSSINTTAKRLFISQSTISESIKRLEWELNAKLLHRSHTGVDLTADGKFLLSQALPIMEHYQQVLNYFNQKKLLHTMSFPSVQQVLLPKPFYLI